MVGAPVGLVVGLTLMLGRGSARVMASILTYSIQNIKNTRPASPSRAVVTRIICLDRDKAHKLE
jgi:hypothetical protein